MSDLKWWVYEKQTGKFDRPGISLVVPNKNDPHSIGSSGRIVSISIDENRSVRFTEQCDDYYSVALTMDDAIDALNEAIEWIEANTPFPPGWELDAMQEGD